jgi:hypothetical protein
LLRSKYHPKGALLELICQVDFLLPLLLDQVLAYLRAPIPVDTADLEECLMTLANGDEECEEPRIPAVTFEKWYRHHYQELEEDD